RRFTILERPFSMPNDTEFVTFNVMAVDVENVVFNKGGSLQIKDSFYRELDKIRAVPKLDSDTVKANHISILNNPANLYNDKNSEYNFYLDANGKKVNNSTYILSNYIELTSEETYRFENVIAISLFDKNLNFIGRRSAQTLEEEKSQLLTIPKNICFVRLNIKKDSLDNTQIVYPESSETYHIFDDIKIKAISEIDPKIAR